MWLGVDGSGEREAEVGGVALRGVGEVADPQTDDADAGASRAAAVPAVFDRGLYGDAVG